MIVNLSQLAQIFDVSPQTISAWMRRGLAAEKGPKGYQFDTAAVIAWERDHRPNLRCAASTITVEGEQESTAGAERRRTIALANLRELELAEKRGKLIDREDVEAEAFKTGRLVRDNLLALPDRVSALIAAESDPVRVHAILSEEFRKALSSVAHEVAKPPAAQEEQQ